MSGIAGIFYRDGRPVQPEALLRMLDALAHRGPDESDVWCEGPVGLGHCMLWTTVESAQECLPLAVDGGSTVLTMDARIDNRPELRAALGLADHPEYLITDSELILAAYQKWGRGCTENLLGDFAFAIWDARRGELFCARDPFGVKPFYYHLSDHAFIFASEIKALLALPEVPRQVNELRAAQYLIQVFDDRTITFYERIQRLAPAHWMTVQREGVQSGSYWSLDPERDVRLRSNEAYAEAFREIFTQAVSCRLRSTAPLGALLSGGLDSTSVSSLARQILGANELGRLKTFSAVFDKQPEVDERPFIQQVLDQGGFEPQFIVADQLNPFDYLDDILRHQDEPFYAPNLPMMWQLYQTAAQGGVRVLLDGFDGDTTVSHGYGYPPELARAGRWLKLAVELRGLNQIYGGSFWGLYGRAVQLYGINPLMERYRPLKLARRGWRKVRRSIGGQPGKDPKRRDWLGILHPDFARRTEIERHFRAWQAALPDQAQTTREQHYRLINQGLSPFALEVLDRAAAAFTIEPRYPFWDKRLVEFCLALPADQKLNGGWSRIVLRRAMAGLLPEPVRWRRDKSNFFPVFERGLLKRGKNRLEEILGDSSAQLEGMVDRDFLWGMYEKVNKGEYPERPLDVYTLWQVVSLALWMQQIETVETPVRRRSL